MTSPTTSWFSSASASHWHEVQKSEFCEYNKRIRDVLETVCASSSFRASSRSCEFLRHIVLRSLEGDTDALKERLIGMVLLGRDAKLIAVALAATGVPLIHAGNMEEAVDAAFQAAKPGDAVLLSPACASFDMFRNYGHRAEVFIDAVKNLETRHGSVQ